MHVACKLQDLQAIVDFRRRQHNGTHARSLLLDEWSCKLHSRADVNAVLPACITSRSCAFYPPAVWRMFDLATLYGFWTGPTDCFSRYFGYKGKQSAAFMARTLKKAASLDTYKPDKSKKKKKKLQKSKSTGSASSFAASTADASSSVNRSKSAPAGLGVQGKQGSAKVLKSAAASAGALAASGCAQSDTSSRIPTALQPPVASVAGETASDAASLMSASPSQSPTSSSDGHTRQGSARFSSSDSDNA
jgi:hypothetical protein